MRRSKKLPADQNQLMEAVKDNRSFFVCLFRAMKPNQTTSICLLRAIKAQPTNFCLFVKSSQTRPVEFCSDSTILKQSEQNFFFVLRPASWLEVATYILCAPILLTLAAQTFQWRNDFVLFSTFQ